ncbi:MAG: hypothetical protein RQ783_06780 [Gammaproteobacteria bacterium]|nr:hypothetical protein [Gammaproteobacteria bacterium]
MSGRKPTRYDGSSGAAGAGYAVALCACNAVGHDLPSTACEQLLPATEQRELAVCESQLTASGHLEAGRRVHESAAE